MKNIECGIKKMSEIYVHSKKYLRLALLTSGISYSLSGACLWKFAS